MDLKKKWRAMPSFYQDQFLIRDLHSRYADICSRQAFNELVDLIAPNAKITLDLRGSERSFTGPVEIGDFIAGSLTAFDFFLTAFECV